MNCMYGTYDEKRYKTKRFKLKDDVKIQIEKFKPDLLALFVQRIWE